MKTDITPEERQAIIDQYLLEQNKKKFEAQKQNQKKRKVRLKDRLLSYSIFAVFVFAVYAVVHIPSTKKHENILLTAPKKEVAQFIFTASQAAFPRDQYVASYDQYKSYLTCAHYDRYVEIFEYVILSTAFRYFLGHWLAEEFTSHSDYHCAQSYRNLITLAQKMPWYRKFRYITAEDLDSREVTLRIAKLLDAMSDKRFKAAQQRKSQWIKQADKDIEAGLIPSFQ